MIPDLKFTPKTGWVYCITDLVSGKKYVGQTVSTIYDRWKMHVGHARSGYKTGGLYLAILNATSRDQFTLEVLEEVEREELSKREQHWINTLNTLHPNGYNRTSKGKIVSLESRLKMRNAQRLIYGRAVRLKNTETGEEKAFESCAAAEEYIGAKRGTVIAGLYRKGRTVKHIWEIIHND